MITVPKITKSYEYAILYRILDESDKALLEDNDNCMQSANFRCLFPSPRYWYADPLLLPYRYEKDGSLTIKPVIYVEVFDRIKRRGHIGVCEFNSSGILKKPRKVIDEPFHMSFPTTFYYHDELYMIPETNAAKELRIYKEMNNQVWELYYSKPVENSLVDIVHIPEENKELLPDKYWNMSNTVFFIAGEKSKTDPKKVCNVLFGVTNIDDSRQTTVSRIAELSDYSYVQRNGGGIQEYKRSYYRVRQYSDGEKYGVKVQIDRIDSLLEEAIKSKDITIEDIKRCVSEKQKLVRKYLSSRGIIGIHTYDTLASDDDKGRIYEVVDCARKRYILVDIINTYISALIAGIRKRIKVGT